MIRGIYTVRDEISTLFMPLQINDNHNVAIRNFDFAMQNNEMMKFRPEDFSLWYLGDFDDVSGEIDSKDPQILKRGVKRGKK